MIELLAIIVILAIIAVITVPIILNIIENARKGAAQDSAYGFKDSINKWYLEKLSTDTSYNLGTTYTIQSDSTLKNTESSTDVLAVNISGQKPTGGWVKLSSTTHTIDSACMIIGDYKVTFENGSINETIKGNSCPTIDGSIDWEEKFATAKKHPNQSAENGDIGIDKNGEPVNLDLWGDDFDKIYRKNDSGENSYFELVGSIACECSLLNFIPNTIENGKIKSNIPQYIKLSTDNDFYRVTTIGEYAFRDSGLTEMPELPNSITIIGDSAFNYNSFTELTIPNSVTTIGKEAFSHNGISKLTIENGVTTIGENAFEMSHGADRFDVYIEIKESEKPSGWDNNWIKGDDDNDDYKDYFHWGYTGE